MTAENGSKSVAPKTSKLGWDMDHVWLVREGVWVLEGEWRHDDGRWSALKAAVEVEAGQVRFLWEGEAGPYAGLEIASARSQGEAFGFSVLTDSVKLPGRLEVRGTRQFLAAREGVVIWHEQAFQRADGSVEVAGSLDLGGSLETWQWSLRAEALEEVWTIPATVVAEIKVAARAGSPIEQCGLLAGKFEEREIVRQIPMQNVDQSEDHFTIDPTEQFRATKSLRGTGTEVVGSWHSHPFSPARLSDEDLSFAQDETALYAIVSLLDPSAPVLNIWKVEGGRARLVPLRIRPD